MTRVAIYARVSTGRQEKEETIETQLKVIRDYCEREGLEVVAEFNDEGVPGTIPFEERPGGSALLRAAKAEDFERTLLYDLSRLGRDELVTLLAENMLKVLGVPFLSVTEPFPDDDQSPFAIMTKGSTRTINATYRAMVRQSTTAGRRRSASEGNYPGSVVPYGYAKVDRKLVVDEETSVVVRHIFEMATKGLGSQAISTVLNEEHVPTPSTKAKWGWTHTIVHKIIAHRRYVGELTYGGEQVAIPAIIDEENFEAVQATFAKRRTYSKGTQAVHMLARLLRCRECGGGYSSVKWGDGRRYFCLNRKLHKEVEHKGKWWWQGDVLDQRVLDFMHEFAQDPKKVVGLLTAWAEDQREQLDENRLPGLRKSLDELNDEEERVVKFARKKRITEAQLVKQLNEIKKERAESEAKVAELEAANRCEPDELELMEEIIAKGRELLEVAGPDDKIPVDSDYRWQGLPEQTMQAVVRGLFDVIWVEADGTLTAEGKFLPMDTPNRRS